MPVHVDTRQPEPPKRDDSAKSRDRDSETQSKKEEKTPPTEKDSGDSAKKKPEFGGKVKMGFGQGFGVLGKRAAGSGITMKIKTQVCAHAVDGHQRR